MLGISEGLDTDCPAYNTQAQGEMIPDKEAQEQ